VRSANSETVFFVNSSGEALEVEPIFEEEVELGLEAEPLILEPFGVAAIPRRGASFARVTQSVLVKARAVAAGEGRDARV
jgi:hypothetical protein